MIIFRAYNTRISPNRAQIRYFNQVCGCCRLVFNKGLELQNQAYKNKTKRPNSFTLNKFITKWKRSEYPFLNDVQCFTLQEEFRNLDKAWSAYFRRLAEGCDPKKAGKPKFKSKYGDSKSFSIKGIFKVESNRIMIPKAQHGPQVGWIKIKEKGYLPVDAFIKHATVSEHAGKWYISLLVEEDIPFIPPAQGPAIGLDVGVASGNLIVTSDGVHYPNPQPLKHLQRKRARLQRQFDRQHYTGKKEISSRNKKSKGSPKSKNAIKTKAKLAKVNHRISCIRKSNAHVITSQVVYGKAPSRIGIESLNVAGMLKNHHLAKSISDAGLGELLRQVQYKAAWNGSLVFQANQWYPSTKTCSNCGHIQNMSLSTRTYNCPECGFQCDRDENAARNLAALAERGIQMELTDITKDMWESYLNVQMSGVTNMFDLTTVCRLSKLERDQVLFIMDNYDKLTKLYTEEQTV